jgi:hypothetical protein
MPEKTKSPSAKSTSPKGRNRKDAKDALKLVKAGGRAGFVAANKVLVTFEDGSKGVYWATPAEQKKREAASKAKSKRSKKNAVKKKAKKTAKKRGGKKPASKAGRPRKKIAGMPNLQNLTSVQLAAIRHAVDGEISARIVAAEKELGSLKKLAS